MRLFSIVFYFLQLLVIKKIMDGEQLPKATMVNFIKKTITQDFSQPYVQKLMDLSKGKNMS